MRTDMKIKLVGALPPELRDLGLKPGNMFDAYPAPGMEISAVNIRLVKDGEIQVATVFARNYLKI
jgi:hypothetical protein